ncbi:putative transcription factor tfiih subunit [Phaeomoniella chlamydospora]|uniref:General transcription and DNA repair factor IIH subunit TFB4 n=1 Tax=Phaeomoniella chlamydospora TaxID=158046 RepID=A0A0G2EBF0_PHACM|nr:putative transcription factor tfiih subunit [Phaeomoniella chlamydospora]
MNAVDGSEHYEKGTNEPTPSLLTVILDTNPAAWSILADDLSLSAAISDILIFINAHLAFNYTNKVAVIASHCSSAKWLYPTPSPQADPAVRPASKRKTSLSTSQQDRDTDISKKARTDDSTVSPAKLKLKLKNPRIISLEANSNKYRPFRLVEEEVIKNLSSILSTTTKTEVANTTSTMIAGALTLALSYINREMLAYAEANGGGGNRANATDPSTQPTASITPSSGSQSLQSRILLISVSPSTDLAHQYIPIMNSIFACQRLSIPIDICQIPLSSSRIFPGSTPDNTTTSQNSTSTVFLQQASDATHGIYIPLPTAVSSSSPQKPSWSLLQYLLFAFLPSNTTRRSLILPTRIDVDFRAACFCHRRIVDIGFVCSICLSIFCSVPEAGECLTCGSQLSLGDYGARPIVIAKGGGKKKKKKGKGLPDGGGTATPTPTPTAAPTPGPS